MEQTEHNNVEREIHLYDYLEVLLRRKWAIILCLASVVLIGGIITYIMTPVYEASTSLLSQEPSPTGQEALFAEITGLPTSSLIPSQIEIIKSRTIAEKVVRELQYDHEIFSISRALAPQISDMEIPDKFMEEVFKIKFTDNNGSFTVTGDGEDIGKGIIGAPFNSNSGLSFEIKQAGAYKGASFQIKKTEFNEAVRRLQENISVSQVKNTNVIKIDVKDSNPGMAADIANAITDTYIRQDISQRSKEANQITKFVNKQLEPTQRKLAKSLDDLAVYKKTTGVIDLKEGTRKLIENVSYLEKEKTALILKEQQIRNLRNEIRKNTSNISSSASGVLGDPVVQGMISRLSVMEGNRKSLLADYTARHPQIIALSAEINESKKKINSSVVSILNSIRKEQDTLSKEIDRIKSQLGTLPQKEKDLASLILNKEVLSNIHTFLLQKLNEATIMQASTISLIQVIDPAIIPDEPIRPNKMLNILLSMILGLFGGIGLAVFIEYLDNSIKSPRDVEERLGLSVFGRIPFIPEENPGRRSNSGKGLITLETAKSITAESFRSLRTNLQFAGLEKKGKIFHLTSPESSEGKTTIVANLGITLALMGGRTLIIDLDLRRPAIHRIFGINKWTGITHLLTGRATFEEVVKTTSFEHLSLIPAGLIPPNPSELLSQENLSKFLDEIREQFDFILIDSPPVLPVTDAQLLGRLADTSFLVIELGKTSFPAAEHSVKQLRNVNVNVAGAVINKIQPSRGYGYYYYYHRSEKKAFQVKLKSWKETLGKNLSNLKTLRGAGIRKK